MDANLNTADTLDSSLTLWTPAPKPPPKPDTAALIDDLTEREAEILRLVAMGLSNNDIGDNLVISERTVRTHVSSILSKLALQNRTQATLVALGSGLMDARSVVRYSHRNGEAEPPTEVGAFWMEIPDPWQRDHMLLAQAPWGEWRMRRSNGEWEPYRPHRLRMMRARFWGPNGTPWDDE